MLPQYSKIPSQRQLLHFIRLLARQNAHLNPMILPKLHHRAVRNPRPRPLPLSLLIRTPKRGQIHSMANSIVIKIQRSSVGSKLSLILKRNLRLQIRAPSISLQIAVEVLQRGQDVEILIASR